jgi:hypothetical protein
MTATRDDLSDRVAGAARLRCWSGSSDQRDLRTHVCLREWLREERGYNPDLVIPDYMTTYVQRREPQWNRCRAAIDAALREWMLHHDGDAIAMVN